MQNNLIHYISKFLTLGVPLSLGLGISPIVTLIFYLFSLYLNPGKRKNLVSNSKKNAFFLGLALSFSIACWFFYEPTIYRRHQEFLTILLPASYWMSFTTWSFLAIFPLLSTNSTSERIRFINLFLIGCALWGILIMCITMLKIPPPYYGNAINPIFGHPMNTTGIAYLLSMAPIVFYINVSDSKPLKYNPFSILFLVMLFATSSFFAIQIQERTFFIIAFIVCPLMLAIYASTKGKNKYFLFAAISIPTAYILFKSIIEANFQEYRGVNLRLFQDLRFQLFKNWLEQITNSPWIYPNVTFIPNKDHGPPTPWFHNFFMDAQRVSGPIGILTAIMISIYIFHLELKLLFKNQRLGFRILTALMPVFLILNTAVFPDAELQFFLLYLSLGMFLSIEVLNT